VPSAPAAAEPVSVVRRFHDEQSRAYAEGEMEGVAELLCDDAVWHVPGESAIAGNHRGRSAVLVEIGARQVAFEVDDVDEEVRETPLVVPRGGDLPWASGVAQREGGGPLIPILDLDALEDRIG